MPLTDSEIRNQKPRPKLFRLSDGGGLLLEVAPTGAKRFRLSYRHNGAQRTMTLGEYPALTLADARYQREVARRHLRSGADPRETLDLAPAPAAPAEPKTPDRDDRHPETFGQYLRLYLFKRRAEGAAAATMSKLELHAELLTTELGETAAGEVTARDVLRACRVYERAGKFNSANAVRILASQVFRFAAADGAVTHDPAALARDALTKAREKHHAAVIEPKEVGLLLAAIRAAPIRSPQVRAGLLLSAYLAPRNLQLREMRWADIQDDVWTVPGEFMKMGRDHLVPLPRQASEVLEWIRPITGSKERVLHSFESGSGLISENTFNKALDQLGYDKTRHRHHGFRTTFSTTLNERGWNWDWIEMQLVHVEENKVRGAYNRALYLEDRKRMMQAYADLIDGFERGVTSNG